MKRAEKRAGIDGRHLDEAFAKREFEKMWPGEGICLTHFDKFEEELRPGDERWLFDNSGAVPSIWKHHIIEGEATEEGVVLSDEEDVGPREGPAAVSFYSNGEDFYREEDDTQRTLRPHAGLVTSKGVAHLV